MSLKIGFMQGRLSPLVDGRIQSFPWNTWEKEITHAKSLGFSIMEWTLDQDRLSENPLMTYSGQTKIAELCKKHDFAIPALTGDCFMQAPFWKTTDNDLLDKLKKDFNSILEACSKVAIKFVVVPLVDNGRLENMDQENILVEFLMAQQENLNQLDIKVVFESDFYPTELKRFISRFNSHSFGINYDTGNSAGLGLNPIDEFDAIGKRILNVHIKDRPLGGTTVPLGEGHADFPLVFSLLEAQGYQANYILQTARATDGDHGSVLLKYKSMVESWVVCNGS
jgi:L-ribulose-5-phosphate 3-epimerase